MANIEKFFEIVNPIKKEFPSETILIQCGEWMGEWEQRQYSDLFEDICIPSGLAGLAINLAREYDYAEEALQDAEENNRLKLLPLEKEERQLLKYAVSLAADKKEQFYKVYDEIAFDLRQHIFEEGFPLQVTAYMEVVMHICDERIDAINAGEFARCTTEEKEEILSVVEESRKLYLMEADLHFPNFRNPIKTPQKH